MVVPALLDPSGRGAPARGRPGAVQCRRDPSKAEAAKGGARRPERICFGSFTKKFHEVAYFYQGLKGLEVLFDGLRDGRIRACPLALETWWRLNLAHVAEVFHLRDLRSGGRKCWVARS